MFDTLRHAADERRHARETKMADERLAVWANRRADIVLDLRLLHGASVPSAGLVLSPNERGIGTVTNVSLVEVKRHAHYVGGSSGVSVPLLPRIRGRVGRTHGRFVQGRPRPEVVDVGTLHVTSTRVVFRGASQVIDLSFAKLIAIDYRPGEFSIAVSNHTTTKTFRYGPAIDVWVRNRMLVALAVFRDETPIAEAQLEEQLARLDAEKPET